jgi:cell division protein FtsB
MSRLTGFFLSKGFKLILILVVLFGGYKFYLNQREIIYIKREIARLEQELDNAEAREKELKEKLENINDPEYIEEIARKELGLVKPGELLLIPVEEKGKEESE